MQTPQVLRTLSILCWTVLFLLSCTPSGDAETGRRPHVVLIVMDTTAASHLSLHGHPRPTSPNLERIAAEGAVFRRAFSTAPWTLPSHASMFTGLYLAQHGAGFEHPHLNDGVVTLAEILRSQGYRTVGYSNNAWIGDNTGLHRGFEQFTKVMTWNQEENSYTLRTSTWTPGGYENRMETHAQDVPLEDSGAAVTNRLIRAQMRDHDFAGQPIFLFVNFLEPHLPYRPPSRFSRSMFPDEKGEETAQQIRQDVHGHETGVAPMSSEELALLSRLYDGEVAYVDHRVGELLEFLEEREILDDTMLVITADHGEQIGEHGFLGHNLNIYDDLLHVPLVVRYPGLFEAGSVFEAAVETRDIFSSIVSIVHPQALADVPVRGIHPLPTKPSAPVPDRHLVAEYDRPVVRFDAWRKRWPELDFSRFDRTFTSIRSPQWKLIVTSDGGRELYDLQRDPGETVNLAQDHEETAATLEAHLDVWRMEMQAAMPAITGNEEPPPMDEETRKKLRSLGYIN
jgi:arylsulfatase A-like enzyme